MNSSKSTLRLPEMLTQQSQNSDPDIISTELIAIVENTLIFDNTVYQVCNISSIALEDLTKTYAINSKIPAWYWFLLALGFILLFTQSFLYVFAGMALIGYVIWLLWQHSNLEKSKTVERYGLRLVMNSRETMIFTSSNKEFILKVIVNIYKVLNSEKLKAMTFNFKTFQVEDKSVNIGSNYNSPLVSGQVVGDVIGNLDIY